MGARRPQETRLFPLLETVQESGKLEENTQVASIALFEVSSRSKLSSGQFQFSGSLSLTQSVDGHHTTARPDAQLDTQRCVPCAHRGSKAFGKFLNNKG